MQESGITEIIEEINDKEQDKCQSKSKSNAGDCKKSSNADSTATKATITATTASATESTRSSSTDAAGVRSDLTPEPEKEVQQEQEQEEVSSEDSSFDMIHHGEFTPGAEHETYEIVDRDGIVISTDDVEFSCDSISSNSGKCGKTSADVVKSGPTCITASEPKPISGGKRDGAGDAPTRSVPKPPTTSRISREDRPCCSKDVLNAPPLARSSRPPTCTPAMAAALSSKYSAPLVINRDVASSGKTSSSRGAADATPARQQMMIPKSKAAQIENEKQIGNSNFKSGSYGAAIQCYTNAIDIALQYG